MRKPEFTHSHNAVIDRAIDSLVAVRSRINGTSDGLSDDLSSADRLLHTLTDAIADLAASAVSEAPNNRGGEIDASDLHEIIKETFDELTWEARSCAEDNARESAKPETHNWSDEGHRIAARG